MAIHALESTDITSELLAAFDSVIGHYVLAIVRAAEAEYEVDINKILLSVGLSLDQLKSEGYRTDAASVFMLVLELLRATSDESIGLKIGQYVEPNSFHILGYLALNSSSLQDGIQQVVKYERLMLQSSLTQLTQQGETATLSWRTPYAGPESRYFKEAVLSGWIHLTRRVMGGDLPLIKVCFDHPAPANPLEYERVFGCPVEFDAEQSAVEFPSELLALSIVESDPVLNEILQLQADQMLQEVEDESQLTTRVRRVITQRLSDEALSLVEVAQEIGVSPRVLHNNLKKQGHSFNKLVAEVKKVAAVYYLKDNQFSLVEVAHLVGFSDQSSFNRAFRRWLGESPGDYRKRLVH